MNSSDKIPKFDRVSEVGKFQPESEILMTFESTDKKCCRSVIKTGQEFIDVRLFINSYFVLALKFSNKNCKIMIFFHNSN